MPLRAGLYCEEPDRGARRRSDPVDPTETPVGLTVALLEVSRGRDETTGPCQWAKGTNGRRVPEGRVRVSWVHVAVGATAIVVVGALVKSHPWTARAVQAAVGSTVTARGSSPRLPQGGGPPRVGALVMVPLGRPTLPGPASVTVSVHGQGRWHWVGLQYQGAGWSLNVQEIESPRFVNPAPHVRHVMLDGRPAEVARWTLGGTPAASAVMQVRPHVYLDVTGAHVSLACVEAALASLVAPDR